MAHKRTIIVSFILVWFFQFTNINAESGSIGKSINSLYISVDEREELISVIQYLGDYFNLNKLDIGYKSDIDDYFADLKDHEAVKYVQKLTQQGFSYDAPPTLMLYFSEDLEISKTVPDYIYSRIGGEKNLKEFSRLIRKFYIDSDFNKFFNAHTELYNKIVNDFASILHDFHEIDSIEIFYGEKQNSYNIVLSLLNSGNYGPSIETNSKKDIYGIISAKGIKDGKPIFGNKNDIEHLVWHEFGHSFVNHLTSKNSVLISSYADLLDPIQSQMEEKAYKQWESVVNEHIIRSINILHIKNKYGIEMAQKAKYMEIYGYFCYIEPFYEQLEYYEKNRNQYKTFSDFYPSLIANALNKAKKDNYPEKYLKNLNSTFKDIDFIVISGEMQEEPLNYVKSIKDKFFKDIPLITDREALGKDIKDYNFLIYGTIESNLFLQEFEDSFPIHVYDSAIIADNVYKLKNGKIIFNMKNPLNSGKFLIVYTAQRPEGIIDINNVFHGPTNYVVFENRKNILKSGYIVKESKRWICK